MFGGQVGHCVLSVCEASHLYSSLTAEQRDELLQCLLIAISQEDGGVSGVIQAVALVMATEEMERAVRPDGSFLGGSSVEG